MVADSRADRAPTRRDRGGRTGDRRMEGLVTADARCWAVVLAGGSGNRLKALTTDAAGTVVPKQYCSFFGGPSLLRMTIRRMSRVVDSGRIVVVVSAMHRRWWESELADIPPDNIIVQPCNRGTACGVLLPLTSILARDPGARIVVSPSDNYVEDEETLVWSLVEAEAHVAAWPRRLVLLGMKPDRPDADYGWITPEPGCPDRFPVVTSFVEKPDARRADELMRSGALWSSFTFVTTGETLMNQFRRSMPWLVDQFSRRLVYAAADRRQHALLSLYDRVPNVDFSRRVLEHLSDGVHVLPVPPCGWTDLGTPQRVSECAMRRRNAISSPDRELVRPQVPDAAVQKTRAPKARPGAVDLAEVALRAIDPSADSLARERSALRP